MFLIGFVAVITLRLSIRKKLNHPAFNKRVNKSKTNSSIQKHDNCGIQLFYFNLSNNWTI